MTESTGLHAIYIIYGLHVRVMNDELGFYFLSLLFILDLGDGVWYDGHTIT